MQDSASYSPSRAIFLLTSLLASNIINMGIGAIIALSSSCLTVARFAASAAMGIHSLRERYSYVGRDIDGLSVQMNTVESALSQLSSVLSSPSSSLTFNRRVSSSIQSCVAACSSIIADIQTHIRRVQVDVEVTA